MNVISEQYDDHILVYDYDEVPMRPFKLSLEATAEDIKLCKEVIKEQRELDIFNNQPKNRKN